MRELWPQGPKFSTDGGAFPVTVDSVALAAFSTISKSARRFVDLGCGSGIITVLLADRYRDAHVTGIEISDEAAALARRNIEVNTMGSRCDIYACDIRRCRELFTAGEFDLAVSNPPYFQAGSGRVPADSARAAARGEEHLGLAELCSAASYLLGHGRRFSLVHRPERLNAVFAAMTAAGIEPKRLRFIQHTAFTAPNLVLLEGRCGGKPGGLDVLAPLVLRNADGSDSDEIKTIYHII